MVSDLEPWRSKQWMASVRSGALEVAGLMDGCRRWCLPCFCCRCGDVVDADVDGEAESSRQWYLDCLPCFCCRCGDVVDADVDGEEESSCGLKYYMF
nr:hypothetical protein Itr_chr05CG09710 [Ipomoea trifida]